MSHVFLVSPLSFKIFAIASLIAIVVMLRYAFIAATDSNSPRKAKARLIASLIFSSLVCAVPAFHFCYTHSLPVYEFTGIIESVRVLNSTSKHYSAWLYIRTTNGGNISVHASDRSSGFRAGQHLTVRFRGDIAELVEASFNAPDGSLEGKFHSTEAFTETASFLFGLFCVWASIVKYRRDPDGREN